MTLLYLVVHAMKHVNHPAQPPIDQWTALPLDEAQAKYAELRADPALYSASLCAVVQSTDYDPHPALKWVGLPEDHPRVTGPAKDMAARLRGTCDTIRRNAVPMRDLIGMLQQAADLLDNGGMPREGKPEFVAGVHESPAVLANVRQLMLDMGNTIRAMDDDSKYSELWMNDGEYIPDPRYSAFNWMLQRAPRLAELACYTTGDDVGLENGEFLSLVQDRIACDLREGTFVGGLNSNSPPLKLTGDMREVRIERPLQTMGGRFGTDKPNLQQVNRSGPFAAAVSKVFSEIAEAKPLRYVVDGSTTTDPLTSVFDSDPAIGEFAPFVVFDVQEQRFIPPQVQTREQAQRKCDELNAIEAGVVVPIMVDRVYVVTWDNDSSGGHDWLYQFTDAQENYNLKLRDSDYNPDHLRLLEVRLDPPKSKIDKYGIESELNLHDLDGFQTGTHIILIRERQPLVAEPEAQPILTSKKQHMRKVLSELELDTDVTVQLASGGAYRGKVAETSADNVLALCTGTGKGYEYVEYHESVITAVIVHKERS